MNSKYIEVISITKSGVQRTSDEIIEVGSYFANYDLKANVKIFTDNDVTIEGNFKIVAEQEDLSFKQAEALIADLFK